MRVKHQKTFHDHTSNSSSQNQLRPGKGIWSATDQKEGQGSTSQEGLGQTLLAYTCDLMQLNLGVVTPVTSVKVQSGAENSKLCPLI
jgi:hypothetical protein